MVVPLKRLNCRQLRVAAIPEGLPICVTVTSARRFAYARRNTIVKSYPSSSRWMCHGCLFDKLTQTEMTYGSAYTLAFPKTKFV
jgi:magnesium-transporting ATPase (P-type)